MKLTDEQREKAVRAAQAAVDVPDYSDGRWWSDIADAVAATLPDAPRPITWEDMREGDRVRVEGEALIDGSLHRDSGRTYYLLARKPDPRLGAVRGWLADEGILTSEDAARDLLARLDALGSES